MVVCYGSRRLATRHKFTLLTREAKCLARRDWAKYHVAILTLGFFNMYNIVHVKAIKSSNFLAK